MHTLIRHLIAIGNVLESGPAIRVLARKRLHNRQLPDLSPAILTFFYLLFVMLHPPKPILEQRAHHDGVVALSDYVLVDDVRRRIYQCVALPWVVRRVKGALDRVGLVYTLRTLPV